MRPPNLPEPAIYHWYHPEANAPDYVKCVGFTADQMHVHAAVAMSQPNCLTCRDYRDFDCLNKLPCTKGNLYQPALAVVLWETI
jgi:hypothetical protein